MSGMELVRSIMKRGTHAIEFEGLAEKDNWSDDERLLAGRHYPALRLRRSSFQPPDEEVPGYAALLFEHLDPMRKTFQVVDVATFDGRELAAEKTEAGSLSAHVVIRFPEKGGYDDGMYRCAIESASPITRTRIESFLGRQIRRLVPEWTYQVDVEKKTRTVQKSYHFSPKLELLSDVSRLLTAGASSERHISYLKFTKRNERQSIGGKTEIKDQELFADVELTIKSTQLPEDNDERADLAAKLIAMYRDRGFKPKIYWRNASGGIIGGEITHHQIEGAHDLLLCPKEFIVVPAGHKPWTDKFDRGTVVQMKALLDKDELWERAK